MSLVGTADATDLDFQNLPIMYAVWFFLKPKANSRAYHRDFTHINSHEPTERKKLANEVRDACMRSGFFYGLSLFLPVLYSCHRFHILSSQESRYTRQLDGRSPPKGQGFLCPINRYEDGGATTSSESHSGSNPCIRSRIGKPQTLRGTLRY